MPDMPADALRELVASVPVWYHTLDLAPGLTTPGWFDLRAAVKRMPWPEVAGLRCLDVGTYDGFLAFELERRGAREVVAIDLADHTLWDWPVGARERGPAMAAAITGGEKSTGFRIAATALGSQVQWQAMSVYDLDPEVVGSFDVVVCGSLLLHLRDPLRALEAIRGVCTGQFLSAESIDLELTAAHPRKPVVRVNGTGRDLQWWEPNLAGHRQLVRAGGFTLERTTRPYVVPFGPAHPALPGGRRSAQQRLLRRALAGGQGVPHSAVLARPVDAIGV